MPQYNEGRRMREIETRKRDGVKGRQPAGGGIKFQVAKPETV
jgi:hypothetical protein